MKLVIATPLYPPELGGPATYAKILEEELPKQAGGIWEVDVVKFKDVRALPKLQRHFAYARLVYRAALGADAVLALDPVSVGFPAMLAARWAQKPFFVKIVGDYAWEQGAQRFGVTESLDKFVGLKADGTPPKWRKRAASPRARFFQFIQRRVAFAAKRIIVPSEYLKRVVTAWGVPAEKISVVYNAGPQEEKAEEASSFAENMPAVPQPYLITVARLVPWKGVADALEALAILRIQPVFANLRYLVLGDGPERANLEALARDLHLAEAVIFAGAAPHGAALRYMRNAAAFILPTRYEGLSHTILEAFVEGTPVVTTPIGGNPELVTDGETGLMAAYGDPDALASAIERVLNDAALRGKLITAARSKVESFTRERMVGDTVAIISA